MRHASIKVLFVSCVSLKILADISLATFSYLTTHLEDNSFLDSFGFLPLIFVICIVSVQSIGVFPVFHLLMAEIYPSEIRSLGIGLTISASLSCGAVNILMYSYLIEHLQFFGTFYFYATVQFVAVLWGFFMIPDNRGLSLAKVEEKLRNDNNKAKEAEAVVA
jgi:MFS family permease